MHTAKLAAGGESFAPSGLEVQPLKQDKIVSTPLPAISPRTAFVAGTFFCFCLFPFTLPTPKLLAATGIWRPILLRLSADIHT